MADNITMLVFNKDEGLSVQDILNTEKGQEFLDQLFQYLKEKIEDPETKFIETIAHNVTTKYQDMFYKPAKEALTEYFNIVYYGNNGKNINKLTVREETKQMTKNIIQEKINELDLVQHIIDEIIKDPKIFSDILNNAIHETLIDAFTNAIRGNIDMMKYSTINESRERIMNEISNKMQQCGYNFQN